MPSCWRKSSTTSMSCWIKKARDVTELNMCRTRRCRAFGTWSIQARKCSTTSTALWNASAYGLRGYIDTLSPLVAMNLLDRSCVGVGIFLFSCNVPNSGIMSQVYARWYVRLEHKEVVGGDVHTAYHQCLILIRRYCWMKRPGQTLHDHVHETGSTDRHATSFA